MLPKKTKSAARKRALIIFFALLAANGGITHILINQITTITSTHAVALVKNAQVSLEDAGTITSTDSIAPIVDEKPVITTYTVQSGDTISSIAEKHNVSVNTIRWANTLDAKAVINVGDTLTILPVTGIQYTVKSGDTVSSIAKKFDTDQEEIIHFNALEEGTLNIGETIIIPDAEPVPAPQPKKTESKKVAPKATPSEKKTATASVKADATEEKAEEPKKTSTKSGYYTHPIPTSILTQGLHGYNSVDFGAPIGTPVYAAAAGKVIVLKGGSAWNGGYGNYIVIEHDNGTQTLYAHLNSIAVSLGETVSKGEQIGKSGNTGRSTGPHLHFEVRGGTNPWVGKSKGTQY